MCRCTVCKKLPLSLHVTEREKETDRDRESENRLPISSGHFIFVFFLQAYCPKHSKKRERNTSESEPDSPRKSVCGTPKKEMTEEEKATLRAER